ncbi:MAG: hypothetical protein M5U34_32280 [Chloroflexi bacterium]|nr:hypothetical protein [Chloroflexota bacterium]
MKRPTPSAKSSAANTSVYAPDDQQGFPSGFGPDGLLFTADDPIVQIPAGYTIVDMDSDPFIFDRARHQTVDLIEPAGAALDDYSALSYAAAFDALIEQLRKEYAFTEYKNLDWDAIHAELRPAFEAADGSRRPGCLPRGAARPGLVCAGRPCQRPLDSRRIRFHECQRHWFSH